MTEAVAETLFETGLFDLTIGDEVEKSLDQEVAGLLPGVADSLGGGKTFEVVDRGEDQLTFELQPGIRQRRADTFQLDEHALLTGRHDAPPFRDQFAGRFEVAGPDDEGHRVGDTIVRADLTLEAVQVITITFDFVAVDRGVDSQEVDASSSPFDLNFLDHDEVIGGLFAGDEAPQVWSDVSIGHASGRHVFVIEPKTGP